MSGNATEVVEDRAALLKLVVGSEVKAIIPETVTSAALRPIAQQSQEHRAPRLRLYSSPRYVVMPQAQPELKKVPLPTCYDVLRP